MCTTEDIHRQQLTEALALFREQEFYTDVILIAGEARIPAHRVVLSAASKYFKAMFSKPYKESSSKEVAIDVDGGTLLEIVNFCYTGILKPSDHNMALRVFELSDYLGISHATAICYSFLKENVKLSKCLKVFTFADLHNLQSLRDDAFQLIVSNFNEVRFFEDFLHMSAEQIGQILQSDELNVHSEKDVFNALMDWYNFNQENRESVLTPLLSLLNLPSLPSSVTWKFLLKQSVDYGETMQMLRVIDWTTVPLKRGPKSSCDVPLMGVRIECEDGNCSLQFVRFSEVDDIWFEGTYFTVPKSLCGIPSECIQVLVGNSMLFVTNSISRTVFKFELATEQWESFNVPREDAVMTSMDDNLYIVGGERTKVSFADDTGYLGELRGDRFDEIQRKASMMWERKKPAVCVLGRKLYVTGGLGSSGTEVRHTECYDSVSNTWGMCSLQTEPASIIAAASGDLYCMSRWTSWETSMLISRYNSTLQETTKLPALPECLRHKSICSFNNELILSGKNSEHRTVCVAYNFSRNLWRRVPEPAVSRYPHFRLLTLPEDATTRKKWLKFMFPELLK